MKRVYIAKEAIISDKPVCDSDVEVYVEEPLGHPALRETFYKYLVEMRVMKLGEDFSGISPLRKEQLIELVKEKRVKLAQGENKMLYAICLPEGV